MIRRTVALIGRRHAAGDASLAGIAPAAAQGKKIVVAIPGIPPIYSVTIAYVAEKQGFFKKYGADVEIRPFDNGTAAARAVVAGDIDMAWSPTPPVINQVSNADVPLVAVYGMPNPGLGDRHHREGKTCKDLVGQDVGVDSINGARSVALRSMLTGCRGVKIEDIKQIALGSSPGPALLAGRLHYAVLHLDDLAEIEHQGKKLQHPAGDEEHQSDQPLSHHGGAQGQAGQEPRRLRAHGRRHDRGRAFHAGSEERRCGGRGAAVTGHNKEVNKAALKAFLAIDFWAAKDDGMPRNKIEAVAALMKKIGSIKPDKEPVSL